MNRAFALFLVLMLAPSMAYSSKAYQVSDKYTLLKMVDDSDAVFIGTLAMATGIYCDDPHNDGYKTIMTEVLVRITTKIKGEPNRGDNHVRFWILGGTAYNTDEGEVMMRILSENVEFKQGEQFMLFLSKNSGNGYYDNYPYGRLHVYRKDYGKRAINDSKVRFLYKKNDDSLRSIALPIELATVMAKAFLVDKDATLQLENQIKTLAKSDAQTVTFSSSLATTLKASAQQSIDDAEEE